MNDQVTNTPRRPFDSRRPITARRRFIKPTVEIPFTHEERTVKKYTVADAVKGAEAVLSGKTRRVALCLNVVSKRSSTEAITLVELNDIQAAIVDDSLFNAR
jgi:hypothetical protein